MRHALVVFGLLVACTPAVRTGPSGADATASGPGAPPAPAVASASGDGTEGVARADRAKLLQRVLDLDALAPFWHAERAGRSPLRIVRTAPVSDAPRLVKHGTDVVWVEAGTKDAGASLEVTRVDAAPDRVTIEFRYPIEGVVGMARFERRGADWILVDKRVAER